MVRNIRLISGLVLTIYVVVHLVNHSLGLISFGAMEAMRRVAHAFWSQPALQALLYLSLLIHFLLALWGLFQRHNLRLARWEATQLVLGLLIVPLVAIHVIGTRGAMQLFDIEATYQFVTASIWLNPRLWIQQIAAVLVVWAHLTIGLHFWLRLKPGYPRLIPVLYATALLLPVLALLGFYRAGVEVFDAVRTNPGWLDQTFREVRTLSDRDIAFLKGFEWWAIGIFLALLTATLLAREIRRQYRQRFGSYRLSLSSGRIVTAQNGTSLLEALRAASIPHAAVCGGRGRCTTCRVRIDSGLEDLDPPSESEQTALARISAPPDVRLACQTRPSADVAITALLTPSATARSARRAGGVGGREQQVAIMFIDLRGSTSLAEHMLPYDVVYVLNHFFAEMSAALAATGGHYAQFNGDGLMALYGLDGNLDLACRQALGGAVEMLRRLDRLNLEDQAELGEPLRIGIGIHYGDAIVGRMGPPQSPIVSAIGDNVNVAARLESLTKTFGCNVVVSEITAERSGLDLSAFGREEVPLKGRREPIAVLTLTDVEPLAGQLSPAAALA